jgi:hypothetical protein
MADEVGGRRRGQEAEGLDEHIGFFVAAESAGNASTSSSPIVVSGRLEISWDRSPSPPSRRSSGGAVHSGSDHRGYIIAVTAELADLLSCTRARTSRSSPHRQTAFRAPERHSLGRHSASAAISKSRVASS